MAGAKRKLSLPSTLLSELGIQQRGGAGGKRHQKSRKEQRKDARVQKRQASSSQNRRPAQPVRQPVRKPAAKPQKKPATQSHDNGLPFSSDDELTEGDFDDDDEDGDDDGDLGSGFDDDDEDEEESEEEVQVKKPKVSKVEMEKIAEDEKEIAKLEKKLGLKGKKKLPKSFEEDGLGDLLEGLGDSDDELGGSRSSNKRKAEADEWLAQKRRKAEAAAAATASKGKSKVTAPVSDDVDDSMGSMDEDEDEDEENSDGDLGFDDEDEDDEEGSEDEDGDEDGDEDDFGGFSEDDEKAEPEESAPRQRENPYVAPTTNVAKYVPPSLRNKLGSTDQVEAQLRRRIQGLINRLTNDNMTGILKDITDLYSSNPRQVVTSTLVDIILALVCSPEKRPDSFFTMIAGFIAGVHKTMGVAVSAQFLQNLVETLEKLTAAASGDHSDAGSKHLVSLLAELYNIQVIGSNLIFDYVRLFLEKLSELNTELLLRIIQLSGPSLRRDDPSALRDIVSHIKPNSMKDMSVRTRFMIDEMKKLQSNKAKAVAKTKDLAELRTQIRKKIGTLKGSHDTQPLRVGLKDIQDSDKQGKWWLVGASWVGNQYGQESKKKSQEDDDDEDDLADETITQVDDDLGIPDLWQLAREQGFNTEVRQRIFVALHAASDCDSASQLIQKLKLNKHQRKEIAEVIVRSGERQNVYNHYYTLLADRFSADKEMRFQFRRCLTIRFKKMGEEVDTGDGGDMDDLMDETGDEGGARWLFNTAKLFAYLVAWRTLRLVDVLKYRNLAALQEKAHIFIEVLLLTILQECKGDKLREVFSGFDGDLDIGRGIQYFLKRYVRSTELVDGDKKAKKVVKKRCDELLEYLETSLVQKVLE